MSRRAWITLLALSCAGSAAAVRLARPRALDEVATAAVLLAFVPSALVLLVALLRRPVGVLAALLMPVLWLYIASGPDDPLPLWGVPLCAGVSIMALVRADRIRGLPPAAPLIAAGLALALLALPPVDSRAAGTRAVVVGVPDATWANADPLVAAERLPHISGLAATGRSSRVRATPRHHPCELWHALLDGAGRNEFVLPGPCAPAGREHPPDARFLAAFEQVFAGRARIGTVSSGEWLDAVRAGARWSTLRRMATELIARPGGPRSWYWDLAGDVCAERLRTRNPAYAALCLPAGDPRAAGADAGALQASLDRALGRILRAASPGVGVAVVSAPDPLDRSMSPAGGTQGRPAPGADGFLILRAGAARGAAGAPRSAVAPHQDASAGNSAAVTTDTLDVPAATAAIGALLGWAPAPAPAAPAYIGSQ